jgi:MoxR-like ATPase
LISDYKGDPVDDDNDHETPLKYHHVMPDLVDDRKTWQEGVDAGGHAGDRRDGSVYLLHPQLRLALDVAWATGRPLLVRGEPGSGKSSLAPYVARNLGARYYEEVVTASGRVEDFLWRFDTVAKLSDAQARRKGDAQLANSDYMEPGVLWKAFDPDGQFGSDEKPDAVVLIDEIDKADPDVPNGLLVPLGSGRFQAPIVDREIVAPDGRRIIVIITTNEERQLPPAFLRRCIVAKIPDPTVESLQAIARLQVYGPGGDDPSPADATLFLVLAERLMALRDGITKRERPPGVAEYLDAVWACRELQIVPSVDPALASPEWAAIEAYTLRKATDEN